MKSVRYYLYAVGWRVNEWNSSSSCASIMRILYDLTVAFVSHFDLNQIFLFTSLAFFFCSFAYFYTIRFYKQRKKITFTQNNRVVQSIVVGRVCEILLCGLQVHGYDKFSWIVYMVYNIPRTYYILFPHSFNLCSFVTAKILLFALSDISTAVILYFSRWKIEIVEWK